MLSKSCDSQWIGKSYSKKEKPALAAYKRIKNILFKIVIIAAFMFVDNWASAQRRRGSKNHAQERTDTCLRSVMSRDRFQRQLMAGLNRRQAEVFLAEGIQVYAQAAQEKGMSVSQLFDESGRHAFPRAY